MPRSNSKYKPSHQMVSTAGMVVYLIVLSLGCSTPATSRPILVDTLSVRELYPEVLQIARAWKEDAYLVELSTTFWTRDSDELRYASFSFRSRSTSVIGLHVGYDPATGSFEDEWLSVAKEPPQYKEEIADNDWCLDSVDALSIAQGEGGSEFLAMHFDEDLDLHLQLDSHQVGPNSRTVWFVTYYAGMPPRADFRIVIDAVTGEVLEIDNEGQ